MWQSVSVGPYRPRYIYYFPILLYLLHIIMGAGYVSFFICIHHYEINDGVCLVLPQMAELKISPNDF